MGYADQCAANEKAGEAVTKLPVLELKLNRIITLLEEIKERRFDPTFVELTVDSALYVAKMKI